MTQTFDPQRLRAADPARDLEPDATATDRARCLLEAALAAEPAPRRQPRRAPRRAALVATGAVALVAALAVVLAAPRGTTVSPAQAFAQRLQGGGVLHMTLVQKLREGDEESTNPATDEVWIDLQDGSWRGRHTYASETHEFRWDHAARTFSVDGEVKDDDIVADRVDFNPMGGTYGQPLREVQAGRLKVAGETVLDGETVYDLVPTDPPSGDVDIHWYVTHDGVLRQFVTNSPDTIDQGSGHRGPSSLSTVVTSAEVLHGDEADAAVR